jgi:hypothetical protein
MGGAITIRCFQLVAYIAIAGYRQPFFRQSSEVVKLFWPRVYSISNTDIPIHLGSIHRCMNAA